MISEVVKVFLPTEMLRRVREVARKNDVELETAIQMILSCHFSVNYVQRADIENAIFFEIWRCGNKRVPRLSIVAEKPKVKRKKQLCKKVEVA